MDIKQQLSNLIEGEVKDDAKTLEINSEDTSIFHIKPSCVTYPKHTKDVKALVKFASEHPGELTLTARAAGTDMSGGPLTSSVVVSFTEYFNRVISVNEHEAITQPGVFYRDFDPETLKYGVILPSYTASRELNTVGGMVANNSAGEKSLTYGKTDRWVRQLRVVMSDGNEYTFRKLNRQEFEAKKAKQDFEGEIYRRVEECIVAHHDAIVAARPPVAKNSAGYYIWNVWDEAEDTFDLTQLFVGSQGTLGLITEITFGLIRPKTKSRMLVMFLRPRHVTQLGKIVNAVLAQKPESFESYDDKTFNVMIRVFPKLFMRLGGNPFKLAWEFLPELKMLMTGGIPKLVLMAEFVGDDDAEILARTKEAEKVLQTQFNMSTHITNGPDESNKYWIIRRESFKLLRENVHGRHTAPFIDDLSVNPKYLPEFLPKLYAILGEYKLIYTVAGHVGDGNFHIIPLMDFTRPDFVKIVRELSERVYTLVGEYHGSITGEHNDGLIRTPYLYKMYSPEVLGVFDEIKNIFDPKQIFNPHKKVDPDMDLMVNSIKKEVKE